MKLWGSSIEIILWHGCSPVVCRAFFGAPAHKSTSEGLLWNMLTCKHLLLFYENRKWMNFLYFNISASVYGGRRDKNVVIRIWNKPGGEIAMSVRGKRILLRKPEHVVRHTSRIPGRYIDLKADYEIQRIIFFGRPQNNFTTKVNSHYIFLYIPLSNSIEFLIKPFWY